MLTRRTLCHLYLILLIGFLTSCADKQALRLGPQQWNELDFVVEARPTPLRAGMTEFIVIASREGYKPGVGLIVSIRINEKSEWRQAIQDGFTGVYRRAIPVSDPLTEVLSVHVRKSSKAKQIEGEDDETVLYFPLNPEP